MSVEAVGTKCQFRVQICACGADSRDHRSKVQSLCQAVVTVGVRAERDIFDSHILWVLEMAAAFALH